MRGFRSNQLE